MGGRGTLSPLGTDIGFFDEDSGPARGVDMNVAPFNPQSGYKNVESEKALGYIETKMDELDHEQMFIMDSQGYIISAVDGERTKVGYTFNSVEKTPGNVVTHNHPRKGYGESGVEGGTFSRSDIRCLQLGMKEMRAVGNEGTYSMEATGKADPEGLYNTLMRDKSTIVRRQQEIAGVVEYAYEKGRYKTKHDAEADSTNQQMRVIHDWYAQNAGKYGYKYTFTQAGDREQVTVIPPKRKTQKEINRENSGINYGHHKKNEFLKQGGAAVDREALFISFGYEKQADGSLRHPKTGDVQRLFEVKR